jgi:hypothetical protein
MKRKSVHEPKAKVMSAADAWDDAQQIATVLKQNLMKAEPVVRLQIPLSAFLIALDNLNHDELVILHKRVEQHLAV